MMLLNIILIILNLLVIFILSGGLFVNGRICALFMKLSANPSKMVNYLLIILYILDATSISIIAYVISIKVAALISSLFTLHCAYRSYYAFQRYASPISRNGISIGQPWFYPCCIIYGLIAFSLCVLFNFMWLWLGFIVPLWLFYGYLSAEIEIRRRMKEMNCDRSLSVFSINGDMGRHNFQSLFLAKKERYPFP
jgi:hypothetical protein